MGKTGSINNTGSVEDDAEAESAETMELLCNDVSGGVQQEFL